MKLVLIMITALALHAEMQMAPDGTFVNGTPQQAPDGTFVGEGEIQQAPDGSFVNVTPEPEPYRVDPYTQTYDSNVYEEYYNNTRR